MKPTRTSPYIAMEITGSEGVGLSAHRGGAVTQFLNTLLLPISHNYSHFPPITRG